MINLEKLLNIYNASEHLISVLDKKSRNGVFLSFKNVKNILNKKSYSLANQIISFKECPEKYTDYSFFKNDTVLVEICFLGNNVLSKKILFHEIEKFKFLFKIPFFSIKIKLIYRKEYDEQSIRESLNNLESWPFKFDDLMKRVYYCSDQTPTLSDFKIKDPTFLVMFYQCVTYRNTIRETYSFDSLYEESLQCYESMLKTIKEMEEE